MKSTCLLFCLSIFSAITVAAPLAPEDVPESLQPWVDWVLHDTPSHACPWLFNEENRQCAWPGTLTLVAGKQGAQFSQNWQVYGKSQILLPGNEKHWPQSVTVNGETVSVINDGNRPMLTLSPGQYKIQGQYSWESRPPFLTLPADTGLIDLTLDANAIIFPEFDTQQRLWLRRQGEQNNAGAGQAERLELRVYRKLIDDLPSRLVTRLELDVAGRYREVLLGPVLDMNEAGGWIPMALSGSLPARLEQDGKLRLQVRPGQWVMTLEARHTGPLETLAMPVTQSDWPAEEIWVFEAQAHLRQVEITGVNAIDPQQTGLPDDWRQLPAYRMQPADSIKLVQQRRGDPTPAPDQLNLKRELWLDFDGGGYTVQDQINGQMTSGWRLEMQAPAVLGRVSVNGQNQFITTLDKVRSGVEVRQGQINLEADSRIDEALSTLPATGWAHDFQSAAITLNLPPGWRLLAAGGIDNTPNTWLQRWSLLDLFLVLITAVVFARLWDWRWGLFALVTLVLIYHEPDAPVWIWLNLLAVIALLRVLPAERWFTRLLVMYRNLSLLALLILALPFMVEQVRNSLFPQLARGAPNLMSVPYTNSYSTRGDFVQEEAMNMMEFDDAPGEPAVAQSILPSRKPVAPPPKPEKNYQQAKKRLIQIDPQAQVQTGPGLPQWHWESVRLSWNGPVRQAQTVELYLLSPTVTSLLGLLRTVLLGALAGLLIWMTLGRSVKPPKTSLAVALPWLLAGGLILHSTPPTLAAEDDASWPPQYLLDTLQQRLLAAPECLPDCANIATMQLQVDANQLQATLEIHAAKQVAVPLPGEAKQWLPRSVTVNGVPPAGLLRRDGGYLWLVLPPGVATVEMTGELPSRASVQLPLPLKPRYVSVKANGWQVQGLHRNGIVDGQLEFTREADENDPETLEMGALPGFVEVERTLLLGLDWRVDTFVRRLTPTGAAVVLEIPLLPGESVTSEIPRVKNGKALLSLAPNQTQISWQSVFDKQPEIKLVAPTTTDWREVWRLDASAIWHVDIDGIPVVHHQDQGRWLPEWRPWPGETVSLKLDRPTGVPGRDMTIDAVKLRVEPGRRDAKTTLTMSLRSSRGSRHIIELPTDAELQSLSIDGASQPVRQSNNQVTLPVHPGNQSVSMTFQQPQGMSWHYQTPSVTLNAPSANSQIELDMPRNRWILLTGGPAMGPAVLFWGILLIVAVAAVVLGRLNMTPLKTWEWLLLGAVVSQLHIIAALVIAAWLLALHWRGHLPEDTGHWRFNLVQLSLLGMTIAALGILLAAIGQGLLGHPDMQIDGNGSGRYLLRWYQDRIDSTLPQGWVISLPLLVYQITMLLWALWLAFALPRWLRWGWEQFGTHGLWRPLRRGRRESETT